MKGYEAHRTSLQLSHADPEAPVEAMEHLRAIEQEPGGEVGHVAQKGLRESTHFIAQAHRATPSFESNSISNTLQIVIRKDFLR